MEVIYIPQDIQFSKRLDLKRLRSTLGFVLALAQFTINGILAPEEGIKIDERRNGEGFRNGYSPSDIVSLIVFSCDSPKGNTS